METKDKVVGVVFVVCLCIGMFGAGYDFGQGSNKVVVLEKIKEVEVKRESIKYYPVNYTDCDKDKLVESVACMVEYVKGFYNYTVKRDIYKSLEEIQLNGGDCFDYAHLYKRMGIDLGYKARVNLFYTKKGKGHAVVLLYGEDGYCLIDQLNYKCYKVI